MNKIKTSELIQKMARASEEACKCEDENFFRIAKSANLKEPISVEAFSKLLRASTDFSRFASIRAICKVLQDLDLVENDTDVFNNEDFREILKKVYE